MTCLENLNVSGALLTSVLTIEVFLLTARLFLLTVGNRNKKRPNPIFGQGGTVTTKEQTKFPP